MTKRSLGCPQFEHWVEIIFFFFMLLEKGTIFENEEVRFNYETEFYLTCLRGFKTGENELSF